MYRAGEKARSTMAHDGVTYHAYQLPYQFQCMSFFDCHAYPLSHDAKASLISSSSSLFP
jgi:hypothetical protein